MKFDEGSLNPDGNSFTHLHVHTEYSLLDGAARILPLIAKCKSLGMDSIAITDHGVMYGVIEFYKAAKLNGINPIIGCEVYLAPRSLREKESRSDNNYSHLLLLAETNIGYRNLMEISSIGFLEGFYYKPRIDYETLSRYSEGLICLSACLAGDIPRLIQNDRYAQAKDLALKIRDIFGEDNFFLELQDQGIPVQKDVNRQLFNISQQTGIPIVATNDVHYVNKDDADAHDILLCIQTAKTVEDKNRLKFDNDQFYLKSSAEMAKAFSEYPDALINTKVIADRCKVTFDFDAIHLPQFKMPEVTENFNYLSELCKKGLNIKFENITPEYSERLEYELEMIRKMGYVDYFLIVQDFIKYAVDKGIIVGPGRGSAAGSMVAFALGITQVDPIKYSLIFERFLNPDRISLPDIDIDFCFERRQEVIDYVIEKYGKNRVAQIITFGTMAARGSIRDVGRALALPYFEVDKIAKMIPTDLGMTIDKALETNSELKELYELENKVKGLIDNARKLEGMPRHASTHAAGVVISKDPITCHVPLQKNDNCITTQFSMGALEELGLLKMDFLGLRTLTVIKDTLEMILNASKETVDIQRIPLDDPRVYEMISNADTDGVFQLESSGMRSFLKELKPDNFEDIIAGISLYRPGPMDQIPKYIANKNNPNNIKYVHEALASTLKVTHGCMVYQEQVMQIVRDIAGYSLGRSDLVRRVMSKKKAEVMEKERHIFINGLIDDRGEMIVRGALANGLSEEQAIKIFNEISDFANYAFNKSHAAAYALIAYQTAWLKYHYPIQFMAALMNSVLDNNAKLSVYIQYCRKKNIVIHPPDVNECSSKFISKNNQIWFGLSAIKNVGNIAIEAIVKHREEKGRFKDFNDFCQRTELLSVNRRMIESMIKCGATDSFDGSRAQKIAIFEKIMDEAGRKRKNNLDGQISLFDHIEVDYTQSKTELVYPDVQEFTQEVLLLMEKQSLGLYVTGHPLNQYKSLLESMTSILDINEMAGNSSINSENVDIIKDGVKVKIGGIISNVKQKMSRNNSMMAFFTLEDFNDKIEVIVFPSTFKKVSQLVFENNIVVLEGRISIKEDENPTILLETLSNIEARKPQKLFLKIKGDEAKDTIEKIAKITSGYRGSNHVCLFFEKTGKKMLTEKGSEVSICNELIQELNTLLGEDCVKVQ